MIIVEHSVPGLLSALRSVGYLTKARSRQNTVLALCPNKYDERSSCGTDQYNEADIQ
jgi:hypothetical protein